MSLAILSNLRSDTCPLSKQGTARSYGTVQDVPRPYATCAG